MNTRGFLFSKAAAISTAFALLCGTGTLRAQRPLGIDVSSYNGSAQRPPTNVNWTNVAAAGISFAWAKAAEGTLTDGWIGEDPDYIYNVTHAASAGVIIGSYYYCHPETDYGSSGADAEAAYFWQVANPYMTGSGQYLMPMLDFEQDVLGASPPYTASTLSSCLNEWCNDIVADGNARGNVIKPVVYTFICYAAGPCGGYDPGLDSTVTQWPLDMANVEYTDPQTGGPAQTTPWATWNFWQYNWQGVVSGITSNVDLDVFNGTFAQMQNYVIGGGAVLYYWDPQGTTGANPYTGSMTGSWEGANWSTSSSGRATPAAWKEGQAVVFGVNTGLGTPAYTVTANSNHTFAGMFDGPFNPNSCTVTVAGTGVLTLAAGPQGFYPIQAGDGSAGNITISNAIAGTGTFVAESGGYVPGQIYLNGTNTFSGGVQLGYASGPLAWTGKINFNNNKSFGTGAITLQSLGSGSSLVAEGSAAITIANSVSVASATTNTFVGNAAGVTYSGPWSLGGNLLTFLTGAGAGNIDNISGVISGTAGLTIGGSGILIMSGANAYSGYTTVNAGTLRLGVNNSIPVASSLLLANGATFDMNGSNQSLATIGGSLGATLAAGNIIHDNGTLTLNGTSVSNAGLAGVGAYSGIISGTGGVTLIGGVTTLSGANTYSGRTLVGSGLLVPSYNGVIPAASPVTVNNPGAMDIVSVNESIGSLGGSGAIYLEGGILTVGGANSNTIFSGAIRNAPVTYNNNTSSNGLLGFYYPNVNLSGTPVLRVDPTVNFSNLATNDQPLYPQVTEFSVRWIGQLLTTGAGGNYAFTATSDDGSRLWVNGRLVVDNWAFQGSTPRGNTISLAANTKYDVRLEYMQGAGAAVCQLAWTPPGGGSAIIPSSNLSTYAGVGGLVKTGSGSLTLTGANTYAGATVINAGTLALGVGGSISNSPAVSIASGATFDVSALAAFSLSSNTTLSASGNATPATITGGTTVNLASNPITLSFDGSDPTLTISQGSLVLNSNAFIVNGSDLPGGVYTLIQQTAGNISGAGPYTVSGSAIPAAGALSQISVNGSNVLLTVIYNTTPVTITGASVLADDSAQLFFTGTPGYTYTVESATNLNPPIVWTSLNSVTADTNGQFSYRDSTAANNAKCFYRTVAH